MEINQILYNIDEKMLFVPAFQREYVWKRNDAKNLISSLLNNYPTGTMLTWQTNTPPELKGDHVYSSEQGSVKLILDGQQRITTLYLLIRGEIPPYYTIEEIGKNDVRGLFINIMTMELEYYKKTSMENNPAWVDITRIFKSETNALEIIKELSEKQDLSTDEQLKVVANVGNVQKIKEREFLEQSVPVRASIREAIDIFYRVNSSGVNLTDAELALAQISGFWPDARKHIKKKMFSMAEHGWVFKLDFFIYCLLGVVHNVGSKMEKLHDPSNKDSILEIRPDEFIGVGIQHPLWGLMTWYLKYKQARCLTTGVSIRQPMGAKYALEWDHIFPFSALKKNGYGWEDRHKYNLAQEITNRAILTQTANRTKSNKLAEDYLRNVRGTFPVALKAQVIPEDEYLWKLENYESDYIAKRFNTSI